MAKNRNHRDCSTRKAKFASVGTLGRFPEGQKRFINRETEQNGKNEGIFIISKIEGLNERITDSFPEFKCPTILDEN
jgi:hypothetical protein